VYARKSRDEWRAIIRAFGRSGQTHRAFCARRGLNLGSFRGWLYRLGREASSELRLLPVTMSGGGTSLRVETAAPSTGGTPGAIVVMVGEVELRVVPGSDPAYVAVLVRELGRC